MNYLWILEGLSRDSLPPNSQSNFRDLREISTAWPFHTAIGAWITSLGPWTFTWTPRSSFHIKTCFFVQTITPSKTTISHQKMAVNWDYVSFEMVPFLMTHLILFYLFFFFLGGGYSILVGGFNPWMKNMSEIGSFPQVIRDEIVQKSLS